MRLLAVLLVTTAIFGNADDRAKFTEAGELLRPANYREWVFLSSGLGMTYGPNAPPAGSRLRFDNVYVNPSSYRHFLTTGRWPDGTVLILEVRESESKGSINQHGHHQGSLVAIEANVKDSRRFPGNGWEFFDLSPEDGGTRAVKPLAQGDRCRACHAAHGAVDNTFVQFYPELAPIAKKFGTFKGTSGTTEGH